MIDSNLLINGGKYLFVLYLVISGNYLGNLFGCQVQNIFNNNMLVKHLLGFLTFYFFITVIDNTNTFNSKQKLIISLVVYSIFIMSTKTHYKFWYVLIIGLGIAYTLFIVKDEYKTDEEKKKQIENIQKILVIVAMIALVLGFFYYMGEKKIEYGKDFEFKKFLLGAPTCRGVTPEVKEDFFQVLKKSIS